MFNKASCSTNFWWAALIGMHGSAEESDDQGKEHLWEACIITVRLSMLCFGVFALIKHNRYYSRVIKPVSCLDVMHTIFHCNE